MTPQDDVQVMTPPGTRTLATLSETFGGESVASAARRQMVRGLFDRVAPRYDVMNDLMSLGLHRLWKRSAARAAAAAAEALEGPVVDLAGGTGDLARLVSALLPGRSVTNIDASYGMIAAAARRGDSPVGLAVAEAEQLPLANDSIAVVTLGFGLRNMTDPRRALAEMVRVLKPGGTLVLLEFSTPQSWFAPLYTLYSRLVIPTLGALIAGDRRAYRYLVESIERFPDAETMTAELRHSGFSHIELRRLMFGVAALHLARKS